MEHRGHNPGLLLLRAPAEQETIVTIRHGEKPVAGLELLSCKGLNRALALPKIRIGNYGKASLTFAPNPSETVSDLKVKYSYVRRAHDRAGLPRTVNPAREAYRRYNQAFGIIHGVSGFS